MKIQKMPNANVATPARKRNAARLREFALDSVFTIIDIREKLIVNSKLKQRNNMELILIILVVLILFGGGGYWYTRRR